MHLIATFSMMEVEDDDDRRAWGPCRSAITLRVPAAGRMGNPFNLVLAILGLFALLGLGAGAIYAAFQWHRSLQKPVNDPSQLLAQFRELHERGELSETEFQTIKTQLSYQIRDELRDAERRR